MRSVTRRFDLSLSTLSRAGKRYWEMGCFTRRAGKGHLVLCVIKNRKSTIRAAQCWAVSTGATKGHQDLMACLYMSVSDSLVRKMYE